MASAQATPCAVESLSPEQIFEDVQRELTAVSVLLPASMIATCYAEELSVEQVCQRLRERLDGVWTERWRKAVNAKARRKVAKAKQSGAHTSVRRLLEKDRQQRLTTTTQT